MDSALKLLFVLVTAPVWYKPLKAILLEIARVARIPDEPYFRGRVVGSRGKTSEQGFVAVPEATRQTWSRDDGRISNARWETGRRPLRSRERLPDGAGFPSTRRRTGYNANKSRFGSGSWQGGFGRR